MKYYAIIVAGGKGLRMGSPLPKQFLEVEGTSILEHTLTAFCGAFDNDIQIILVLNEDYLGYWNEIAGNFCKTNNIQITTGGQSRFHSVKNGLALVKQEESIVGIHDAVRPLVTKAFLQNIYKIAETKHAVIPSLPLQSSIRQILSSTENKAVDRSLFRIIQTPQCFYFPLLKAAFSQAYLPDFTDDASVVERWGHAIHLTDGIEENIKITTPSDLLLMKVLLKNI